jgi:hypothetical protein
MRKAAPRRTRLAGDDGFRGCVRCFLRRVRNNRTRTCADY